ncbi:thioredoxin TrxA [Xylogone sp. PMI_703]|nr:thioredoxin TrxA [Xylogone sp. PMI_703]
MVVNHLKSNADFKAAINSPSQLIILDADATWCGVCKAIFPKVESLSNTYPHAKFLKFDIDEMPEVAQELGIRAVPTFTFFKEGEKIGQVIGANPNAIEETIKQNM